MAPGDGQLTRDEIWDDSALVDSWNDALAEYNKYHSIHTNGGRFGDIPELRQNAKIETEKAAQHPFAASHPHEGNRSSSNMGIESTDEQKLSRQVLNEQEEERHRLDEDDSADQARTANTTAVPHGPQLPATAPALGPMTMLGSVQDECLKKLLMSWYYAGYYTGLYQGQQEAASSKANPGDSHR
ncbi:hypothetical protein MKZ38_005939 [Zalerion maritima]|uniref:Survival motor neuron Tudor domain-containing protein n=1 Tax=Zalerion maritima TaxID=339359 RepID=A0AAD5WW02_9PEZI|nr:hypothetical protein MKZ38_005939 [Zalerion maritima]